jgi:4-hydroxy-3-methylbut-2-enyl diphosphate reductase
LKIILAEYSGFCFGVEKAISTSINVVEKSKNKVYSLGPLIHNNQVINKLKEKGLNIIEDINEANNGKVIIRSHGVPLDVLLRAKENNIEIIDATCPFVKKIQHKVKEYYEQGFQIVIIGNPDHPEVIGINGWCNNSAYIINSEKDVNTMPAYKKVCVVAQTTATREKFEKLSQMVAQKCEKAEIFNTICNATKLRQNACEEVAKIVDAMIVIGGYHSSNTQKLVEISKKHCKNTFHIETASELPINKLLKYDKIGITAGASTPDWIIKEVIERMNEHNKNTMDDILESLENSFINIRPGDIVTGTVISVNEDEVIVNVGYKSDGIIKKDELTNDTTTKPKEIVKEGDKIEVFIVKLDDGEGNLILSKRKADEIKGWKNIENSYLNQEFVNAKVIEIVNGGVIALVKGIKGFIPMSHLSIGYVKDPKKFLGQSLDVRIIEFNKDKKRLVLSRKLVEEEEQKKKTDKLWNQIEIGQKIKGTVKKVTDFGAFVDIGGIDGLIHISELSWNRVNHPSEIVNEGDEAEVIILDFDRKKKRVSLGLKQVKPHPWENITEKYQVGDEITGAVIKLTSFGAFIEIEPGIVGLAHISQISNEHISKPSDKLKIGDTVKAKILDIKSEEKKISLSLKDFDEEPSEEYMQYINNQDEEITIKDILNSKDK